VPPLTRRRFLQAAGAAGAFGGLAAAGAVGVPRVAFGAPGAPSRGDALVVVFLRGGMDGLSALVPTHEALYYDRRPGIAIPPGRVMPLEGGFGLHPELAGLQEAWAEGDLAVVPAAGHPELTRSHFEAMARIERGRPEGVTVAEGFLARHLRSRAGAPPRDLAAAMIGNALADGLANAPAAYALSGVDRVRVEGLPGDPAEVRAALEALYAVGVAPAERGAAARDTLATLSRLAEARPGEVAPRNGAVYPDDSFAQSLRSVAQLLRVGADLNLELAWVDLGGFDTHESMGDADGGRMAGVLRRLGDGLGAFWRDLRDVRGEVTVVALAEFGRQVHENGSGGTDHGNGGVMFVLGGGVRGGVHGAWPGLEEEALVDRNGVAPLNDFRDVFAEVLARRVGGADLDAVFPGLAHRPLGLVEPRF